MRKIEKAVKNNSRKSTKSRALNFTYYSQNKNTLQFLIDLTKPISIGNPDERKR